MEENLVFIIPIDFSQDLRQENELLSLVFQESRYLSSRVYPWHYLLILVAPLLFYGINPSFSFCSCFPRRSSRCLAVTIFFFQHPDFFHVCLHLVLQPCLRRLPLILFSYHLTWMPFLLKIISIFGNHFSSYSNDLRFSNLLGTD